MIPTSCFGRTRVIQGPCRHCLGKGTEFARQCCRTPTFERFRLDEAEPDQWSRTLIFAPPDVARWLRDRFSSETLKWNVVVTTSADFDASAWPLSFQSKLVVIDEDSQGLQEFYRVEDKVVSQAISQFRPETCDFRDVGPELAFYRVQIVSGTLW